MDFQRSSGVLLHVSSLPSYGGIGDLGPAAYEFLGFLADAKQHVWQVLPLCPTAFGNSPYAGSSAFAGNPSLISLEFLSDWGWIEGDRIAGLAGRGGAVDFEEVEQRKLPLSARSRGPLPRSRPPRPASSPITGSCFGEFCKAEANWLNDYAMYAVLRREYKTGAWTAWPEPIRKREPQAHGRGSSKTRPRPRPRTGPAIRVRPPVARSAQSRRPRRYPHPRRHRHLRQHGFVRRVGPSRHLRARPGTPAHPRRRRPARLLLRHRPALGQPALPLGCASQRRASTGGCSASPAPASSTTSFASITSADSSPTGPFPPKRKPPSTANGSRPRAWSCFAPWKRNSAPCRWSPKTWA